MLLVVGKRPLINSGNYQGPLTSWDLRLLVRLLVLSTCYTRKELKTRFYREFEKILNKRDSKKLQHVKTKFWIQEQYMIVTQLSLDVVLVFFTVDFEHISHFFSSVSIVDFEQVDDSWEEALWNMLWYETDFYMNVESDKRKIDESFKQPM